MYFLKYYYLLYLFCTVASYKNVSWHAQTFVLLLCFSISYALAKIHAYCWIPLSLSWLSHTFHWQINCRDLIYSPINDLLSSCDTFDIVNSTATNCPVEVHFCVCASISVGYILRVRITESCRAVEDSTKLAKCLYQVILPLTTLEII